MALARYDVSGDLDPGFGIDGNGKVLESSGQAHVSGSAIAIQPDGRIVVGGESYNYDETGENPIDRLAGVWRFTADGLADPTFGDAGWASDLIISGGSVSRCYGLALQADGRIVWGGRVWKHGDIPIFYAGLARFWQ